MITIAHAGRASQASWLLDTGAAASMISTRQAAKLGIRYKEGTQATQTPILEGVPKEKQAEEQLRAATVMLSSLINHLRSGVMVEDESRKITHVNEVFNQKDFRIGMSYAINRKEVNDLVWNGLGKPRQGAPVTGTSSSWSPRPV